MYVSGILTTMNSATSTRKSPFYSATSLITQVHFVTDQSTTFVCLLLADMNVSSQLARKTSPPKSDLVVLVDKT